ncbi:MAG TPA: carbohydrate-binding domain-containing protein [Prolixibacteraceae bacterium]|nr:carbohydrate-binding domain-containing protein [Prolixibacteraceae bacterium]HRV89306.1 carbohydrate-binding domain-containing protein [Prolixibacteraceae bacterium]
MIQLFRKPLFTSLPDAVLATGLILLMGMWGCQEPSLEEELEENTSVTVDEAVAKNEGDHEEASDYIWESGSEVSIILSDGVIVENSDQVKVSGSKVTITAAGNYRLTGKLSDGQVVVEAPEGALVRLILAGVTLTNSSGAALVVNSAGKVILVLPDGAVNSITDGTGYTTTAASDVPNAALYSTADLSIFGNGILQVKGNTNDGIASKDGLIIKSGNITVEAVDDGIRGKDYLVVRAGHLSITCGGDGLTSDNEEESKRGYIRVETGEVKVVSGGDGLSAQTDVLIQDGVFDLTCGGGSSKLVSALVSSKGIKGLVSVIIEKGTYTISTSDDALHSNHTLIISGGTFVISSGDDGMHADAYLALKGGEYRIDKSFEGIESANILLESGKIRIVSSDDGINIAGGNDGSGMGRPGQGSFSNSANQLLQIKGGDIVVYAVGDGIDINGSVEMSGGTLLVHGPTSNNNGALDYDGFFNITGGLLVAAGSAGMAQAPGTGSKQNVLLINFSAVKKAGTLCRIQSTDSQEIVTFIPSRNYQSLVYSSPTLARGTTYDVYTGGSTTATANEGLCLGGTYTPGTKYTSFTPSSVVTRIGQGGMGPGGW